MACISWHGFCGYLYVHCALFTRFAVAVFVITFLLMSVLGEWFYLPCFVDGSLLGDISLATVLLLMMLFFVADFYHHVIDHHCLLKQFSITLFKTSSLSMSMFLWLFCQCRCF